MIGAQCFLSERWGKLLLKTQHSINVVQDKSKLFWNFASLNTHWIRGILELLLEGGLRLRRHTPDYQSLCYQQHGEPQTWACWAWLRHITFLKSCRRIPQFPQSFFLILFEKNHLFTINCFPLKPQWISSPSLLQQETSLNIFRNWKLLSASAQPVKITILPTQLMCLCPENVSILKSSTWIFACLF